MNLRVETLRGLACLLLVGYHVIGADPGHGLRVADDWVRWLNDGLAYVRMPLFTFLSGLVYGLRPFSGNSRAFLSGKARRLLIPMLVVGSLFALLQTLTPGTNTSAGPWYLLHIQPVAHFWFVESLFWVFLVTWALERWQLMRGIRGYLLAFALACTVYLTLRGWSWFSLEGAIYLMPYFLAGLGFSRFNSAPWLARRWVQIGLVLIAVGTVLAMGLPVPNPDRRTLLMLAAGLSLCILLLGSGIEAAWLAGIGRYSYAIYLFHVFFTAATRIGLERIGIDSLLIHVVLGVLLGLAGPMGVDRLFTPFKWPALLLLGKSLKPKTKAPRVEAPVSAAG